MKNVMGYCPCFGSRKGKKLKSDDGTEVKEQCQSPQASTNLSSEMNAPGSTINTDPSLPQGSDARNKPHIFTYRELASATKNFRSESLIGEGGFGYVYKGQIESTGQVVAVKQLNKTGLQGDKEFLVEVLMLSLLLHPNLVNMIGYCAEGDQRLLVYEFLPLGSLEDHLHDLTPDKEPLDWNTRMMIAAGAAKGLNYLHNESDPPVIYRDLKSSNILLDEGFIPKLSDFGLAKFGPSGDRSHVSTRVMGTHGYCAPEYATSGKLTMKSDIYSFGVVLLELITGRKAFDPTLGHGKHQLVDWAWPLLKDRKYLLQLADPQLRGRFLEPVLRKALEVASMCLRENANNRPCMNDVVLAMDYLTSHPYDSNESFGSCAGGDGHKDERAESSSETDKGERGRRISEREGRRVESNVDFEGPEMENSPKETTRMLNRDADRERAVAEAKRWGETWREKRRQSADSFDS